MEFDKINTLIFETLECFAPIETSRVSMFDTEDRYSHLPFCRFKFKNKKKEDEIYKKIKIAVESFEGNLKWKLITKPDSENFLILPVFNNEENIELNDKDYFIFIFGENGFQKKIDESIDDIPKLAKVISNCW